MRLNEHLQDHLPKKFVRFSLHGKKLNLRVGQIGDLHKRRATNKNFPSTMKYMFVFNL